MRKLCKVQSDHLIYFLKNRDFFNNKMEQCDINSLNSKNNYLNLNETSYLIRPAKKAALEMKRPFSISFPI